jgi:hypothetical protein
MKKTEEEKKAGRNAAQAKYQQSDKGKEAGRASSNKYSKTAKGKASQARYSESEKGKEANKASSNRYNKKKREEDKKGEKNT